MNTTHTFKPGDTVIFEKVLSSGHAHCVWLKDKHKATVQSTFKNGNLNIPLHDVYAAGKDGRRTINVPWYSLRRETPVLKLTGNLVWENRNEEQAE